MIVITIVRYVRIVVLNAVIAGFSILKGTLKSKVYALYKMNY